MAVFVFIAFAFGALHVICKLVIPLIDEEAEIRVRQRLGVFVDRSYPPVHVISDTELIEYLCVIGDKSIRPAVKLPRPGGHYVRKIFTDE